MSTHASPVAFTISDTKFDGQAVFPFFIPLIGSQTSFLSNKWGILLIAFAWDKLLPSHGNYFFKSFTAYQHTIIVAYALLANNILISFDRPLCNIKLIHPST